MTRVPFADEYGADRNATQAAREAQEAAALAEAQVLTVPEYTRTAFDRDDDTGCAARLTLEECIAGEQGRVSTAFGDQVELVPSMRVDAVACPDGEVQVLEDGQPQPAAVWPFPMAPQELDAEAAETDAGADADAKVGSGALELVLAPAADAPASSMCQASLGAFASFE